MPTLPTTLIERGVAKSAVYDRQTAAKEGRESTGHGLPAPNTWGPLARHLVLEGGEGTVEDLVRKGVPIDGVGLQSHFVLANPPKLADIASNVSRLNALGLFVHFSELDIRIQNPVTDEKLEQQAELYKSITQTCIAAAKCMGITTWGFTDKYSWITSRYPGFGAALLFDNLYAPKPSYRAIAAALVGAP